MLKVRKKERSYIASSLRHTIKYSDLHKWPTILGSKDQNNAAALSAALKVDDPNLFGGSINKINLSGKDAYTVANIEALLILRLLGKNITGKYRLKVDSRKNTISLLISFLKETSNYSIHRYDVKSFYESFDREFIVNKLKNDSFLSRKNIVLLEQFFYELTANGITGLPRGLGISATLSEMMMSDFDKKFSEMPGVYFYRRFVDDIIILTDDNFNNVDLTQLISSSLPRLLVLHETGDKKYRAKVTPLRNNKVKVVKTEADFSYLGYSYKVFNHKENTKNKLGLKFRRVEVKISEGKIRKMKVRLLKSFISFVSDGDADLLEKRLKFLTGNYFLTDPSTNQEIKSGISYNYSFINTDHSLIELDRFLRRMLFNSNEKLSRRVIRSMPLSKRRDLAHLNFSTGFHAKRFHRFDHSTLVQIKECWS